MNSIVRLILLGTAMSLTLLAAQTGNVGISGAWDVTLKLHDATATPTITLHQEGQKITGTYAGGLGKTGLEGTITGKNVKFAVTFRLLDQSFSATYDGTLDDDTMKGSVQFSAGGSGTWTAQRKRESEPPAKPKHD